MTVMIRTDRMSTSTNAPSNSQKEKGWLTVLSQLDFPANAIPRLYIALVRCVIFLGSFVMLPR
jgi:hypothetical protein